MNTHHGSLNVIVAPSKSLEWPDEPIVPGFHTEQRTRASGMCMLAVTALRAEPAHTQFSTTISSEQNSGTISSPDNAISYLTISTKRENWSEILHRL
jgi:hypothetical protein